MSIVRIDTTLRGRSRATRLLLVLILVLSRAMNGIAASLPISVAVYYYSWYGGPSVHWPDGYLREDLIIPQQPLLGEYSNQNMSVTDYHVSWADTYKITQFICSWFGIGSFPDDSIKNYLLKSLEKSGGNAKFALFYESKALIGKSNGTIYFDDAGIAASKLLSDVTYMADNYFDHPLYLKINGKPVIYFYLTRIYSGKFQEAFADLRTNIKTKYGYELYIVADEVFWQSAGNSPHIVSYDAITAYNMHGPSRFAGYPTDSGWLEGVEVQYSTWQIYAESLGIDFIPGILPGFNDRATRYQVDHYAIPREMNASFSGSGQYTTFHESLRMADRILCESKRRTFPTVTVTSFNEWHEDTQIEPVTLVPTTSPTNATASSEPVNYTQGYTYDVYGFKLLKMVQNFVNQPHCSVSNITSATPTKMPNGLTPKPTQASMLSTAKPSVPSTPTSTVPSVAPALRPTQIISPMPSSATLSTAKPSVPPTPTSTAPSLAPVLRPTQTTSSMPSSTPSLPEVGGGGGGLLCCFSTLRNVANNAVAFALNTARSLVPLP